MAAPTTMAYYGEDPFLHNHLLLKKKLLKLVGGEFRLFAPNGSLALVAHQKGFKLKEEITVYADDAKSRPLIGIYARQIMDFNASYDVVDLTNNAKIGVLRRKGWSSIARDEWEVLDPWDKPVGSLFEDSIALALVRRLLTNLVPQNYDMEVMGTKVVDFKQNFNPFVYHLQVIFTVPPNQFDRRIGVAASILLAAIEGRQRN